MRGNSILSYCQQLHIRLFEILSEYFLLYDSGSSNVNRFVVSVRSMAKRSYELFTSKHSRLFSLGSMKFSWRIVMIVEILIIGLISYWVCRDPRDLREFEESFLERYVHNHGDITKPIPSAFRGRQELTEQLCKQFVSQRKEPRLAVRLLGFEKAVHKPVLIEVVKCGGGVGLIQAPGVNSFFILRKGKQSKRFATRVFNIYRKAYFITPYYSDEEGNEKPIRTDFQSLNGRSAPYPLRAELPRSDLAPRRSYSAEYNARTSVLSDMADEWAIPHVPRWVAEECPSPRLAARSPRQYHTLTDAERYSIRYSPPSQMDRALKLIRRTFSTSRGKRHRMRTESSTLPLSVDVSKTYRSRSAPRGRPRNDDFDDTERTIRQGAITDQVRQPYPQDRYYPQAAPERRSSSVPRQYPSSTRNIARQYSSPTRELDPDYNFRVRLSQMSEDPRARNTSFRDHYATRGLHEHRSDRDDIRQPRTVTTARPKYESMLYEREGMRDASHRSQYANRSLPNHPNYASASEDGHVRRVRIPAAYSQEKRYVGGTYNDYLVGQRTSQNRPTDDRPYHKSHSAEAERVRPIRASATEEPVYAVPHYPDPRFQPTTEYRDSTSVGRSYPPQRERPIAQDFRKLAGPAARPTHGSSTCHKCKATLAKQRQTETGSDWGARTQIASDSNSTEKQGAPASVPVQVSGVRGTNQSRSARSGSAQALRDGRQEVSSVVADDGSDEDGHGRSEPQNFRGSKSVRVSSALHRDEDQRRSSAAQASGARSSKEKGELAKPPVVTDDEVSTASERDYSSGRRRTRTSAPPRSRPTRPKASGGKEKEDKSRSKVTFAVSIDGEPEQ